MVYGKLQCADKLATHFGPEFANVAVSPGEVAVYVSDLNSTTSPDEYNEIGLNVGPFVVPVLPSQPAMATNLVGDQISAEAFGKILSTKNDRKENTRIVKGLVKLKGASMRGVVNLKTGEIKSLVIPVLTKAHLLANKEATLEEHTDDINRILDMNNASRPLGGVLGSAAARAMEDHDPKMIRQLLLGNFSTVAMVTLTEKKSQVERSTLANLWETS